MRRNNRITAIITFLLIAISFGCAPATENNAGIKKFSSNNSAVHAASAKLGVDRQRGVKIVYYKIPAALSLEELIETAGALHKKEPAAQIILVDDDSRAAEYIRYVNETGNGVANTKMPKEWADKHIIANVQKHVNGKFVLCAGRGFQEIAELD
jgi:lipoprotein-anchoring transpeptidase ErfK/SrfK